MAVLISCATGNFTAAATWALVDSTSYLNSETTNGLGTTYTASNTFTPGAITIDGIAVKIGSRVASPSGTVSVALDQGGSTVAGTEITLNVSDLPLCAAANLEGGWVLFKFGSPVTLAAATAYSVKAKTSVVSQMSLCCLTLSTNWDRALRTTTTQAPAAGDDLIVAGEHTGAGTGNSFTVTMDETATTDYGSNTTTAVTPALAICQRGTLSYGTSASTNYYLKLSGYLVVYQNGTLNVGAVGSEIPRTSTAVLEFDCAADGDFGLIGRNGSTINMQGLSRTSGKNIVTCKLAADGPSSANLLTTGMTGSQGLNNVTNASVLSTAANALDPVGTVALGSGVTDNTTSGNHGVTSSATGSVTNTTQVFTVFLRRGTGTNNRYVRMTYGSTQVPAPTNGFYADIDLQAGTIGACTALGNGTATSSSITAVTDGYLCTIIGKASSDALSPFAGVWACNASGGTSYSGDTTQNFVYSFPQIFTASSQPSGTLTVDTDTGWLSGDAIAIASTSRTRTECEANILNSNATSTTLPCALTLDCSHSGTSPTQAEIILLTRNVKVRSSAANAMSFVSLVAGCTFDIDWVEFYYIGQNSTGKRGIEIGASTSTSSGPINGGIDYCSLHDVKVNGIYLFTAAGAISITALRIANVTMWNCAFTTSPALTCPNLVDPHNYSLDHITVMRTNGFCFGLVDHGGVYSNLTAIGGNNDGFSFQGGNAIGAAVNFTAHSNQGSGFAVTIDGPTSGTVKNLTAWRNTNGGINITVAVYDLLFDSPVLFGNNTASVLAAGSANVTFRNMVSNGDSTFSTNSGIACTGTSASLSLITIDNCDFSTVSGIKTAHVLGDIVVAVTSGESPRMVLRNTKLGATVEVSGPSNMSDHGFICAEALDQTAGNHKTWLRNGLLERDTTIYNSSAPSLRMTPSSNVLSVVGTSTSGSAVLSNVSFIGASWSRLQVGQLIEDGNISFPTSILSWDTAAQTITMNNNATGTGNVSGSISAVLESASEFRAIKVPVRNGATVTASVYVRKSASGDGAAYAGSEPRLMLKGNAALGIANDTILDTMTVGYGAWEQLSGTTAAVTDDGVLEFVVTCDGNAGWVNVDDWSIA